jgi:hypothetical protein
MRLVVDLGLHFGSIEELFHGGEGKLVVVGEM